MRVPRHALSTPSRPVVRAQARGGALVALGVVLLGAPLGLLWAAIAPRAAVVVTASGPSFRDAEGEAFIAADGTLFLLGLAAGVAVAVPAFLLGRHRAPGVLLGLLLGSALAAALAWRVGVLTDDRDAVLAALRDTSIIGDVDLPLQLRARAALLGWPLGAGATFAVLELRRADTIPEEPPGADRQPASTGEPT